MLIKVIKSGLENEERRIINYATVTKEVRLDGRLESRKGMTMYRVYELRKRM